MKQKLSTPVSRGRPREFDRGAALDRAMRLFWANGFEATSINDLTETMGITPPSLYAAFGDKKRLFLESVDLYQSGPGGFAQKALTEEPTAKRAVYRLLMDGITSFSDPSQPAGCMVVLAATNCTSEAKDVLVELAARRKAGETAIRNRLAKGQMDGDVPENADIEVLAGLVVTTLNGLSIKARDGAEKSQLVAIVEQMLLAWPENHSAS
jgi:TetR/AcrR family transcriptional regulator, copper-responsive repressor